MWDPPRGLYHGLQMRTAASVGPATRSGLLLGGAVLPVLEERLPEPRWPKESTSSRVKERFLRDRDHRGPGKAKPLSTQTAGAYRMFCVEPKGVPFHRSADLADAIEQSELRGPAFGEVVLVQELLGDWARCNQGWLPVSFHGKRRFVILEPDSSVAHFSYDTETEDALQLMNCSQHVDEVEEQILASVLAASLPQPQPTQEVAAPEEEAPTGPLVLPDINLSPPAEMVAQTLRKRVVESGTSRSTWPRVRLPVRASFMARFGDDWPEALCRCIGRLRPDAPMMPMEVVAVRSLDEELTLISDSRQKVACREGAEPLPAIGSCDAMKWYGDLASIVDQEAQLLNVTETNSGCWVVEIALTPPASDQDAADLAHTLRRHLGRPLASSTDASRIVAVQGRDSDLEKVWHLREVVPRQVSRIFSWPARQEAAEGSHQRAVLKANPRRLDVTSPTS
eukprot:TRINITY_DN13623_c2_g1_i1.p1 TRINITY_DN13623_c2_g1~~TRINITY_DN13623_c2_g1_i1.p1  ORF type:complete len:452 (-),score=77.66 TRINITY_DN13623_c2_g1_i1:56-1411(-)